MSLGDKLAIAGIVVAVAAVLVGAWAVRRWGIRRRRVLFTHTSTRLIPSLSSVPHDALKIMFRDFPVDDPYLLELHLQNIGPLDLTSSDFDAKRSIVFKLNCKLYGLIGASHPEFTTSTPLGSDGAIRISPLLLKRKEACEMAAIVSGKPNLETDFPLPNTDVLDKRAFDSEVARSVLINAVRALAPLSPGGGAAMAVIDALPFGRRQDT